MLPQPPIPPSVARLPAGWEATDTGKRAFLSGIADLFGVAASTLTLPAVTVDNFRAFKAGDGCKVNLFKDSCMWSVEPAIGRQHWGILGSALLHRDVLGTDWKVNARITGQDTQILMSAYAKVLGMELHDAHVGLMSRWRVNFQCKYVEKDILAAHPNGDYRILRHKKLWDHFFTP